MALDKTLKIYDDQGNEVDYDILAKDVKFLPDGKDLPTKLAELEDEIGEGGYTPPVGGIPKTDLAPDVQTSLGKADTALQSFTETDPTVPSWAKQPTKPTYTAQEVGALPADTPIPTKTSDLNNDSGFITEDDIPEGTVVEPATAAPSMDGTAAVGSSAKYAREDHVHPHDTSKQDTISDLVAIRSGAALGATALQPTGMDNAPTANSNNPVKSGGIKQYVDEAVANAEVTVISQGSFGVLNSLASTSTSDALSANKGRELDQAKVNKSDIAMEESVTYNGSVGTIDNTYIKYSNGTQDNTNGKKASDYIDIAKFAGGTMTLSVSYSSPLAGLAFYNSSKSFISGVQYSKQNNASVSIPSNAAYVRFSTNGQSSLTAVLTAYTIDAFKSFIEGLGDSVKESAIGRTKTMTYTEDDCTISGYILTTGASQTSTNFKRSDYIPLAGTSYSFSLAWEANASNAAAGVAFYNSSKQFIGYRNSAGTDIAYPTGAAYAIIMSKLNAATSLSFSLNGVEGFNATFDDMLSKVNQIDFSTPKRHILFVGNSFAANACSMLGTLCTNLGVSNINVQYIEYSGSTLAQWATEIKNNNTRTLVTAVNGGNLFSSGTMSAILSQPWDIIVFQQASASSDDYSTFTPYLSQLVNYVKSLCSNPDVKVAFQMTWQTYQSNYSDIITAAKSMADDYLGFGIDILIPNGTSIQNIRGTSVNTDANDLSEDTNIQHLAAGVAKYVAACCVYASLIERYTGISVYNDTTTTTNASGTGVVNVSASNRQICQRAAVYACIRPFATTPASALND